MSQGSEERLSPTPRHYKVLGRAAEIARAASSPGVRAEHLLLAIINERHTIPAQVLATLVDLDQAEVAILDAITTSGSSLPVPVALGPEEETREGVWGARVALAMGHSYVGVEHVFLEVLQDREGISAKALGLLVDPGRAKSAVRAFLDSPEYRRVPNPEDSRKQFLPEGQSLDAALRRAIHDSVPERATFSFNWEDGRPWIHVSSPGNSRDILNEALISLGRAGLT
jgi:ATP-dependent Clp protease ATP-binding subunit ClpA